MLSSFGMFWLHMQWRQICPASGGSTLVSFDANVVRSTGFQPVRIVSVAQARSLCMNCSTVND